MKTTTGRSTFPRKYDATIVHIRRQRTRVVRYRLRLLWICVAMGYLLISREAFKESSLLISYEEQQTSQPSRCKNFEGLDHAWITELEIFL